MAGTAASTYALPPDFYFWKWSDDGTTMESFDDLTLAFRQEMLAILQSLADQGGIPPLGSLLLVNSACADKTADAIEDLEVLVNHHQDLDSESTLKLIEAISYALQTISSLPSDLRSGTKAKAILCHTIFSRNTWAREGEGARLIVEDLIAEPPANWAKMESSQNVAQRLLRDSSTVIKAVAGLDAQELEQLIRTGIEFPELSPSQFDEDATAETEESRSLLEQLENSDQENRALANIARQVIGLIALPLPASQDDELPIGGVADIVNRGNPDRLLTSELAWGDTILASRLAQNEALYYHRETPPQNAASQRVILMDHGLRYWGLLRLFSLATHLGLKCHTSTSAHLEITSYISTPESYQDFNLDSTLEVRAALAKLPVHLSFTPALLALAENLGNEDSDRPISDVFLISSHETAEDPETKRALIHLTTIVRERGGRLYHSQINEEGDLTFYEYRARGIRKLQEGKLDLDELLPSKENEAPDVPPRKASTTLASKSLEELTGSKFYNQYPPPLWFPAQHLHESGFCPGGLDEDYIGLDSRRYLMRWSDSSSHAIELSEQLPGREHWIGQTEDGGFLVACSGERAGDSARVFQIQETGHAKNLDIEKTKHAFPRRAVFQGEYVIFIYSDFAEAFSTQTGKKIAGRESKELLLHEQTIRVVDGEIAVSQMAPRDSISQKYFSGRQQSPGIHDFPESILPSKIGFSEFGAIILIASTESFLYSPDKLTWESLRNAKNHRIVKIADFENSNQRRFGNESDITTASVGDVKFSHDPRGVIHLTYGNESWTLHTHTGTGSLWKSRDPDELRSASKADFLAFFKKVQHNIIPKKK